jgi:hypothetical protein
MQKKCGRSSERPLSFCDTIGGRGFTMATPKYFDYCFCPHCKVTLNGVEEITPACPKCGAALDRKAVYMTRRYPDESRVPRWVGALGVPLLLIVGGIALLIFSKVFLPVIPLGPGALMIAAGTVYFLVKLNGGDD